MFNVANVSDQAKPFRQGGHVLSEGAYLKYVTDLRLLPNAVPMLLARGQPFKRKKSTLTRTFARLLLA